ncbi:uncharacterized protein [Oscarella lobularis]|uniref:uncharacterized protein n=1 Tax=Oscarella lobularis TaxID=121494 RepID=UPI00331318DF
MLRKREAALLTMLSFLVVTEAIQKRATPTATNVVTDLKQVFVDSNECDSQLQTAKAGVKKIVEALATIKSGRDDIIELHGYVTRFETAIATFSANAQVASRFTSIKADVESFEGDVSGALVIADDIESRAAELRPKLGTLLANTDFALELLEWLHGAVDFAQREIETVQSCVGSIIDDASRTNAEALLEEALKSFQTEVATVKTDTSECVAGVEGAQGPIDDVESFLTDDLLVKLKKITDGIEDIRPDMNALDDLLKQPGQCTTVDSACQDVINKFDALIAKVKPFDIPSVNLPGLPDSFRVDDWNDFLIRLQATLNKAPKEMPGLPSCSVEGSGQSQTVDVAPPKAEEVELPAPPSRPAEATTTKPKSTNGSAGIAGSFLLSFSGTLLVLLAVRV